MLIFIKSFKCQNTEGCVLVMPFNKLRVFFGILYFFNVKLYQFKGSTIKNSNVIQVTFKSPQVALKCRNLLNALESQIKGGYAMVMAFNK